MARAADITLENLGMDSVVFKKIKLSMYVDATEVRV